MCGSLQTAVAALGGTSLALPVLLAAASVALSLGYILWLKTHQRESACGKTMSPSEPAVDVIIPVRNEAEQIADKLANIKAIRYPEDRLRFWIVDGNSADDTLRIASRLIRDDARFQVIEERPNKTAQINAALEHGTAPWVLVTDADSRMHPETLREMVAAAESDGGIGAVGTPVEPAESCHWLERAHWRINNRVRTLESRAGCMSLLTGPCYLVRREVFGRIPEDVVADDIHAALAAARLGRRVCLVDSPVIELRTPRSLSELFGHKLRKTTAYLREIFRFLPYRREIPKPARTLFVWRAAQLVALPWLVLAALVSLFLSSSPVPAAALGLFILGGGAIALVVSIGKRNEKQSVWTGLVLTAFLLAICLTALVTYPLRPRSAYSPQGGARRR